MKPKQYKMFEVQQEIKLTLETEPAKIKPIELVIEWKGQRKQLRVWEYSDFDIWLFR